MRSFVRVLGTLGVLLLLLPSVLQAQQVSGELRRYHPMSVLLDGPSTSELAATNPFLNYRFQVSFSHPASGTNRTVHGFYAADGNSANTSAAAGNKWVAHFTPHLTGNWNYSVSFRSGANISVETAANAGSALAPYNGLAGSFSVSETNKIAPDNRSRGILEYVGEHYLRYQNGQFYLKGGADSPENFLGYADFDQTFDTKGSFLHQYAPHAADWQAGNPTWQGTKGRNIIGALNYLSSKAMNSVYFLTYNIDGGDGGEIWPWTSPTERFRFDVSKLAQWEIVFSHMDFLGITLHVLTQETENDQGLNGGALGLERKLYYRELVARFSHHPALVWNLGEENTNTTQQQKDFANYIRSLDPYKHPLVIHTYPGSQNSVYTPLLGFANIDGPSIQGSPGNVHSDTLNWRTNSANAGKKWVTTSDEIGGANTGVVPDGDPDDPNHDSVRKNVLWGNLMAGGAGVEYYFGYSKPHNDLTCEDWRSRDQMWSQTKYALDFFHSYVPFVSMSPCDSLLSGSNYCLGKNGEVYLAYLKNGGSATLTLPAGNFNVRWFNPLTGGALQTGSLTTISGPGSVSIGSAPFSGDAAALIETTNPNNSVDSIALALPAQISPPTSQTTLNGQSSTGPVANYLWQEVSSLGATIQNPSAVNTTVSNLAVGVYTFRLTVSAANGDVDSDTVSVTVGNPGPSVTSFTLINADSDLDVGFLTNGDIVSFDDLGTMNISIRANTIGSIGSVRFALDGNPNYQTENSAPYALAGDSGGDYNAWVPSIGSHTLTATPYSGSNGGGTAGTAFSITFTVRQAATDQTAPGSPGGLNIADSRN